MLISDRYLRCFVVARVLVLYRPRGGDGCFGLEGVSTCFIGLHTQWRCLVSLDGFLVIIARALGGERIVVIGC